MEASHNSDSTSTSSKEFLYFGYGSNLCCERLRLSNPSAKFVTTAALRDYRLAFSLRSKRWSGGAADIVAAPGEVVWGSIWAMAESDAGSLDKQEGVKQKDGVDVGNYRRITVQAGCPRLLGLGFV